MVHVLTKFTAQFVRYKLVKIVVKLQLPPLHITCMLSTDGDENDDDNDEDSD